jgi:zinc protease
MTTAKRTLVTAALAAVLAAGVWTLTSGPRGPRVTLPPPGLDVALKGDPDVVTGRLDNGLRFYIRSHRTPANRAELRLVVNAGSLLERDDERGAAHFVEHMAFNGTAHFPGHDVTRFLESIGMRYGPSVNATTTFDETVYSLQVPADAPAVLDRAALVLEDWAHGVSFDPAEVARERGVVLEEWRMRRGAGVRLRDLQLPILLAGSRYVDRDPIGTPESLAGLTAERLRGFYDRWYRPDLMAVVAVGDFDAAAMRSLVATHFAKIPPPAAPVARPSIEVPAPSGTRIDVASDREATSVRLGIFHLSPPASQATAGDYRRQLIERLTGALITARLTELAQCPDASLTAPAASRSRLVREVEASTISAGLREQSIETGIRDVFLELRRIVRDGFTEGELDRQRTALIRAFERAYADRETRTSETLAAEYVRNFTIDEPFPGLERELAMARDWLPDVTLGDVNAMAAVWAGGDHRVVLLNGPERANLRLPPVPAIASVIDAASRAPVAAYTPAPPPRPLLDPLPSPGSIVAEAARPLLSLTEWTLSNGAHVALAPTSFKDDEVLVRAVSPGGTSLASDAALIPAQTAAQIAESSGFGALSSGEIRRLLSGRAVSLRPVIGPFDQMLVGGSSRADLETLFQLIHLHFTPPRRDPAVFDAVAGQWRTQLTNQSGTPDFLFASAIGEALAHGHPRAKPPSPDDVAKLNLDESLAFYRARFGDASGFTFIFAGSLDVDEMRPLVERYLASLPSRGQPDQWRDTGVRAPDGVIERRVEAGREPQGRATLVFSGPYEQDGPRQAAFRAMGEILERRLRDRLREALGGTYDVSVALKLSRVPVPEQSVGINFTCDPARTDRLVADVMNEIAKFTAGGPSAREVADVKVALRREFETNSRQNGFILDRLAESYLLRSSPDSLTLTPDWYDALTAAMIQDAARACLDRRNYVKVILAPRPS